MRNHYDQRRICFMHRDVSTGYDEIKVDWTKLYKKGINFIDQMFNLIDQDKIVFNKPTVQIFGTKLIYMKYMKHET